MTARVLTGSRRSPAFDPDAILQAALGLYEASLSGDMVFGTFDRLAPLFGSRMGALIRIDKRAGTTQGSHYSGGDAATAVYDYTEQDLRDDYLYNATRALPTGATYLGSELLTSDILQRSPIYQRLVAPRHLEYVVGGLIENSNDSYTALGFWRSGLLGNYTSPAKQALSLAIPHVRNAIRVSQRLAEAEGTRLEGLQLLEHTRHGVMLLAPSGRVEFVNREAERIVRSGDGIGLQQGQVVFADAQVGARAADLLALAVANGKGQATSAGRGFRVVRPSGLLSYEVLIVPLPRVTGHHRIPGRATILMLISDPVESFTVPFQKLVDDFGLSPAEARFCRAFLAHGSVREAADSIEVSTNTGRSHLKKIFSKLHIQSRSQLFQLFGASLRS